MLNLILDPKFLWPFLALMPLGYLFAYLGARSAARPDDESLASRAFRFQMITLAAGLALWGYIGFHFGLVGAFVSALAAWLCCGAGTRGAARSEPCEEDGRAENGRAQEDLA